MKRKKRSLLSFITVLTLVLNLSSTMIVSAQEIIRESSQVQQSEEITKASKGELKLSVYDDENNVIYSNLYLKSKDEDTLDKVLKRVLSDRVEYLESGDSIYINRIDGIGKTDGEPNDWNVYVNNELVQNDLSKINILNSDYIDIKYESKIDNLSDENNSETYNITISVERRVLGQTDIIKSEEMEVNKGEKVSKILDKLLNDKGIKYDNDGTLDERFYLQSMIVDGKAIGEFDHEFLSGWMYSVNGVRPGYGMSDYRVEDGDSIRICYTAKDFGVDIDAVDKVFEVREKLSEISKLNEDDYTEESWEILQQEVKDAKNKVPSDEEIGKMMSTTLGDGDCDTYGLLSEMEELLTNLENALDSLKVKDETEESKNQPPTIHATDKEVTQGDKVDLLEGVYATDKEDGSVKVNVKETNLVLENGIANTPGEFKVVYVATDKNGASATKEIKITVMEKIEDSNVVEPIIPIKDAIKSSSAWIIKNNPTPKFGDEWDILSLARSKAQVPKGYFDNYYKEVEKTVIEKQGNLSRNKYSEYSRTILALAAIGKDPTNVGGYNLVEKLYDIDKVSLQGINGVIWALIALDSQNYEIPDGVNNSREQMINYLLDNQLDDGGLALSGDKGDIDITAMALQSLANYKEQPKVASFIEKAINFLSSSQKENGGYDSWGTANVESAAQVLVALSSLKLDPKSDEFVKDGNWIVSNIMTFASEDGGFKHVLNGGSDKIATQQSLYSLTAYQRYIDGENSLYDMTDIVTTPEEPENNAPVIDDEGPDSTPGLGDEDLDDEIVSDDDTTSNGNTNDDSDSNTDSENQKPNKYDKDEPKLPQTGDISMTGILVASTLSLGGLFIVNKKRK